jgi:hypothetical protein
LGAGTSFVWSEQSPVLGLNPPYTFALNRTHKMTHEIFGQAPGSRVSWASDIMCFSGQHGAPTIDAIGHIGRDPNVLALLPVHGRRHPVGAVSWRESMSHPTGSIRSGPRGALWSPRDPNRIARTGRVRR